MAIDTVLCVLCGGTLYEGPRQVFRCPTCEPETPPPRELSDDTDVQPLRLADTVTEGELLNESDVVEDHPDLPPVATPIKPPLPRKRKLKKKRRPDSVNPAKKWLLIGLCSVPALILIPLMFWGIATLFHTPPPDVIPAEKWQAVEQAGRFKVLFPGTPRQTRVPLGPITMVNYLLELEKGHEYGVTYSEGRMPPERRGLPAEQLLNDACDGAMATAGRSASEISRTSIQLGDYPGKELIVRDKARGGKVVTRVYYDASQGRIFAILIGARGLEPDHENVKRFFASFEIVKP